MKQCGRVATVVRGSVCFILSGLVSVNCCHMEMQDLCCHILFFWFFVCLGVFLFLFWFWFFFGCVGSSLLCAGFL